MPAFVPPLWDLSAIDLPSESLNTLRSSLHCSLVFDPKDPSQTTALHILLFHSYSMPAHTQPPEGNAFLENGEKKNKGLYSMSVAIRYGPGAGAGIMT